MSDRDWIWTGRSHQFWLCPPCNRQRLKVRRETGRGGKPASLNGARERLARMLDSMEGSELRARLAELLDRSADFGSKLA